MRSQQHKIPFKRYRAIKALLCLTIFVSGFNNTVFAQKIDNDFADRPFLLAINRPADSLAYKYLNMIYSEVFKRLEIAFEIRYIPLKRGFVQVRSGKLDGETTRVLAYEKSHPTLIRIKEALYSTNVSAFALEPFAQTLNGWESLKDSQYKVEYPRGVYISEVNLKKVVPAENLSNITTSVQGIKKLLLGRTDLYIDDELVVFPLLNVLKKSYPGKVRRVGVMTSVPLYMYIHQKNHLLVPRLNKVIKEIKDEGLIRQYRQIVFNF